MLCFQTCYVGIPSAGELSQAKLLVVSCRLAINHSCGSTPTVLPLYCCPHHALMRIGGLDELTMVAAPACCSTPPSWSPFIFLFLVHLCSCCQVACKLFIVVSSCVFLLLGPVQVCYRFTVQKLSGSNVKNNFF